MTQAIESTPQTTEIDLPAALQQVLQASPEPLTVSKIRAQLPGRLRSLSMEEVSDALNRQVAAQVLIQYPKYRSQQDRFWDQPMPVHVAALVREVLQEKPLALSELRRKLPAYAQAQVEGVVQEETNHGRLYRHPRLGRGGERCGLQPPDPKEYLRSELLAAFMRLEQLGFTREQLRAGALELLHDEEWASRETGTGEQETGIKSQESEIGDQESNIMSTSP